MKNVYLKSTFADIKNSLGRFIAIILIILMGVLLFVGIKSVGPNLENTASRVIKAQNLSDTQLVSTMGLTKKDQTAVEKITGVQAELGHSFAYAESSAQQNLQVYSYDAKQKQNKLIVKSGHLPKNKNELVLDQELKDTYKIGQTITIKNSQLTTSQFKVTGFVESPVYISKTERGSTTIGDGQLDGFAYLSAQAFSNDTYSILYVTFANVKDVGQFSDEYKTIMTKNEEKLDKVLATRKTERRNELQKEATAKLATEGETLAASEKQLTTAKTQLEAAKAQLATQKAQLAESGQASAEATASITATETQLAATEKTLTENAAKLAAGKQSYEKAQSTIKNMAKPTFITTLRNSNPGFNEYQSLANQIDAIANVFPVFFFFIAILITFTTMTRMIEENRKEIGTLKALGYRGTEIASKYIIYALLAAFVGTLIGTVVGTKLLPTIVFSMFNAEYIFTGYTTNFVLVPIVIAIGAALIATLGSSLLVLIKELQEKPTALLQPKAPKAGKRVLLERIEPIWSRLNFNHKVTYRNLFRYKARMILTILGIAGCTGLMVAGFGLNDSIGAPADLQFNKLTHYQAIVTLNDKVAANQATKVAAVLADNQKVTHDMPVYSEQVNFKKADAAKQTASLFVTDNAQKFANYVTFSKVASDTTATLTNSGAIISQQLAKIFDVAAGDTLTMQDTAGHQYKLKIAAVVKNYLGHNVYLTKAYYQKLTAQTPVFNSFVVQSQKMTKNEETALSQKLMDTGNVLNTTYMSATIKTQESATENMGAIVFIFIILSGTLAFVVLYNLTNINISERERELATIKVLGLYDKEVTMYIVRENIIFTIFGILFGFAIGNLLTWFIITTVTMDLMVFPLVINWQGYVISAVMTAVFSGIVSLVTHRKLKRIHMIEALKSNE